MKALQLTGLCLLMLLNAYPQRKIPSFRYADSKGNYASSDRLVLRKPAVIIYFDPECGDCQAFTNIIARNDKIFERYKMIMITNTGLPELKKFVYQYHLGNKKDLIVGTEGWTRELQRSLHVTSFPFIVIFNRNRIFNKVLSEKTPEQLYKELEEAIIK